MWTQYDAKPCMNNTHFLPVLLLSSDGRLCLAPVCVAATIIRNHTRTRTHLCLHFFNVAHNQPSRIEDELKGSLLMIRCPLQIWRSDSRLSCLAWGDLVLLRWLFSYGNSYLWGGCHIARLKMVSGPEGWAGKSGRDSSRSSGDLSDGGEGGGTHLVSGDWEPFLQIRSHSLTALFYQVCGFFKRKCRCSSGHSGKVSLISILLSLKRANHFKSTTAL